MRLEKWPVPNIIRNCRILVLCVFLLSTLILLSGCGRRAASTKHIRSNRLGRAPSISAPDLRPAEAPDPTVDTINIPELTTPTEKEPLIYSDTRVSHYSAANPQWETLRFEWECQDGISSAWLDLTLDAEMYRYYRDLERYYGVENLYLYVNDENNKVVIQNIVKGLRGVASDLHYDDAAVAREMAKFVQDCIEYEYDSDTTGQDEYPRYPIETIYERQGDCEDTSILMAALLKEWGYEVGFLHLPGHIAVALRTADDYDDGSYYEINGHSYLFIESTGSGWNIGDIPDDLMGVSAEFYLIP